MKPSENVTFVTTAKATNSAGLILGGQGHSAYLAVRARPSQQGLALHWEYGQSFLSFAKFSKLHFRNKR